MEDTSQIKRSALSGMIWKLAERMGAQVVSLVVSIVLARLLLPQDYSVVSIVTIFFTFANVLISGGFNTALIQKKNADKEDYSTILYVSLLIAGVLYALLFFCAPAVAAAYGEPTLVPIFRVMGLTLPVNAFKAILCAYVSSRLEFRKFFFSTLGGTVLSAVVGIAMALFGFGPWALVAQQMTNTVVDTLILTFTTRVRFVFRISFDRLKGLFGYGWKIFVSSLITTIYDEINPLIIGLKYSGTDLSFYTKGKSFPNLISATAGDTLSAVLFPVMAKVQDDREAVLNYTRRFMRVSSFLVFPLMIGFLAASDRFVLVLLGEAWLPAAIYIKIFCLSFMFNIIQNGNLQTIRAIGRSDIILLLEIIKKVSYFAVIVAFLLFTDSPEGLAVSAIVNTVIATVVNTFPNRKLIGYRYRLQVMDLFPNLLTAGVMGVAVYAMNGLPWNDGVLLLLQIVAGAVIYVVLNRLIRNENLSYFIDTVKKFLKKR